MKLAFFHYHPFNRPSHKGKKGPEGNITLLSEPFCSFYMGESVRFSVRNYTNVIPPQKTHQFPHIKRHHIRFRNCPLYADTQHALPGHSRATQPHSDRVFSGFDRAFGNSDKISTTFDTNSPPS